MGGQRGGEGCMHCAAGRAPQAVLGCSAAMLAHRLLGFGAMIAGRSITLICSLLGMQKGTCMQAVDLGGIGGRRWAAVLHSLATRRTMPFSAGWRSGTAAARHGID